MKIFPEDSIHTLQNWLTRPCKIAITTHKNPDGDAMGSSLGLMLFLRKLGHHVSVVTPTDFDHYLSWLPGIQLVTSGIRQTAEAEKIFTEAQIIFCLDFSQIERCGILGKMVLASGAKKIMVDHHIDPESFPDLFFHVVGISSTAELVFRVMDEMGQAGLLDRDIAENLYTGIMTDTGSFRFSSTTADVHRITARLLDAGVRVGRIHNLIYDNFSEHRVRFLGYVLHQKMIVMPQFRTAYMTISREEQERFSIRQGDTEGFVNYGLSLQGIRFAVLLIEKEREVKLSFRSIGNFPCNEFAAHFSGGGHFNASGGQSAESLPATEQKFLSLLEQFKPLLLAEDPQ